MVSGFHLSYSLIFTPAERCHLGQNHKDIIHYTDISLVYSLTQVAYKALRAGRGKDISTTVLLTCLLGTQVAKFSAALLLLEILPALTAQPWLCW